MRRRDFIVLLGSAAVAPPFPARAEPAKAATSIAERLTGTWQYVSSVNTRSDGSSFDRWGANAKGTLMFDAHGRFVQVIMGGESRIFGAKSFFQFGTYAVDESKSMFVLHPEASSISKFAGSTQRRIIRSLTREELKITNPANSSGAKVESVWKRVD